MLESGMCSRWKNERGGPELLDSAKALKLGRIHDFNFERPHFDVAVHGIANQLLHPGYYLLDMAESFSHTFFDIDVETVDPSGEVHLVKILSVDGRRFTYELRGTLTEDAIAYMRGLMDAAVFSDLLIERSEDGWEGRESPARLKKHS